MQLYTKFCYFYNRYIYIYFIFILSIYNIVNYWKKVSHNKSDEEEKESSLSKSIRQGALQEGPLVKP